MSNRSKTTSSAIAGAIIGSAVSLFVYTSWFQTSPDSPANMNDGGEMEPLYWVAPMDPNYQRDKPGKSPMGMDLIPYYGDSGGGVDAGPGTIRISADVVNNLGVRTVTAQYRALHREIRTVGYVQYDEDKLIHIHPRVNGWIEKLYVKAAGDPVNADEPLYEIYSPELVNAQEELVLAIERKNQRLITAAEDRLAALQIPRNAIKSLKASKKVQQTITFYSPQSGVVDNLEIRQGFFVKPGTTLMSIGALDQVWVEAEVFERQASQVSAGVPVTMTLDFLPGREWAGQVDYVYPVLDAKTRTVKVRLRFDNPAGELKPNMFAQVTIHATSGADTLLVPREAVIRSGNMDRVVLALGDGQYKSIEVKLGRIDDRYIEIVSGLDAGQAIVSSAQFLLDSESSKTSDFKRMNHAGDDSPVVSSVWVQATFNSLMTNNKTVNVSHAAIPEWDWPEMSMHFGVQDSVDFNRLYEGLVADLKIEKGVDGGYRIAQVDFTGGAESAATARGKINAVMVGHRMLSISRGPIEKWDRPAATLDFTVAESIDIAALVEGMEIEFQFQITDGEFMVTDVRPLSSSH